MTENEIRQTIANMRAPEQVKRALLRDCLKGDPRARLSVMAIAKRNKR